MDDPNLPATPLAIAGIDYKLCFDLNSIADAEEKLIASGHRVNLLAAKLGVLTLSGSRSLFYAALGVYHPEISYAEACALFAKADAVDLTNALSDGFRGFLPDPPVPTGEAASPTEEK